jgi:hypothetical protein
MFHTRRGQLVAMRQAMAADTLLLAELLSQLSERALHLRYMSSQRFSADVIWNEAMRMTREHSPDHTTLVATIRRNKYVEAVAVAELVRDQHDLTVGEIALVVITSAANWRLPALPVTGGVGLGLMGVVILVGPENIIGGGRFSPVAAAVIMLAAFAWALGTHYSRHAPQPASPLMSTALNLLAGGLLLAVFGGLTGELARLNLLAVSIKSWLAVAYLVIFGSLVGFSAYLWLVKVTTPAQASSNFYVNPLVAIVLGWALAGETPTPRTVLATLIIIGAVALIVLEQGRHAARHYVSADSSTVVCRAMAAERAAERARSV